MAKQNVIKVITPVAQSAYAWLEKPDEGQQYSDGKYKVTVKLKKEDKLHKQFVKDITQKSTELAEELQRTDSVWKNLDLKSMKMPYRDGDETGKEDFEGVYTLCAKTKFRPGMVDCSSPAQSLVEGDEPRSGDNIRISIALSGYCMGKQNFGVSAQLRNVQLIDRNNMNGSNIDEFGEVEGGYIASNLNSADSEDDDDDFGIVFEPAEELLEKRAEKEKN